MISFVLAAVGEPHLEVRPEIQRFIDSAPAWPNWVLSGIIVLWLVALLLIPFFLWGIYSQSYKHTKLLRGIIDELRKLK